MHNENYVFVEGIGQLIHLSSSNCEGFVGL